MDKIIKLIGNLFWIILIIFLIFWYSQNKDKFFPSKEKIEEKANPINPFE